MKDSNFKPELALKRLWNLISSLVFGFGIIVAIAILACKIEFVVFVIYGSLLAICMLWIFLYIPAFYKTLQYRISDEGVHLNKGVFWKVKTTVPFSKITNIDITQGPLERIFGISTIHVQTAGASGQQNAKAELVMHGISDPAAVIETLKKGMYLPDRVVEKPVNTSIQDEDSVLLAILHEIKGLREDLNKA